MGFVTSSGHIGVAEKFTFGVFVRSTWRIVRLHPSGNLVDETPLGFKVIGELPNEDKIVSGGKESAGLSIKGPYAQKDGIVACLLAAKAVTARGTSLIE